MIELPPSDQELLDECEIRATRRPKVCQQVNVFSALRLKHVPTGIVIRSYEETDRYVNQIICLKKLRLKVAALNGDEPIVLESTSGVAYKRTGS